MIMATTPAPHTHPSISTLTHSPPFLSNRTGEEEHDHEGVDDGEVVDLIIGVAGEVHVPAVAPRHVRLAPLHVVRVDHLARLLHRLRSTGRGGLEKGRGQSSQRGMSWVYVLQCLQMDGGFVGVCLVGVPGTPRART